MARLKESKQYLKWKIATLSQKYQAGLESWAKDTTEKNFTVESLQKEIQHLKAEAKDAKEREHELEEKLITCQVNNEKVLNSMEKSLKSKSDQCEELSQQLVKAQEASKEKLTKLRQEHEKTKLNLELSMQADFDNKLAQSEKKLKDKENQLRNYQIKVEQMKKEHRELEEKLEKVMETLQNKLIESREETRRYMKEEEEERENIRNEVRLDCKVKCYSLQSQIQRFSKENKRLGKEMKKSAQTVLEMKSNMEEKCKIIHDKNAEVAAFKMEKEKAQDNLEREQQKNLLLSAEIRQVLKKNKHLDEQLSQQTSKNTQITEHIRAMQIANDDVIEKVKFLESKLKASETTIKSFKEKVHKLETAQLRFKEDLEACMPEISEPKKLKIKIIALKRRYIDEDKSVWTDAFTSMSLQQKNDFLTAKLQHCEKIQRDQANTIKNMQQQLKNKDSEMMQARQSFITLMNDEVRKVHRINQELKETSRQLHKATKPAQQKLRSWVNKKVLRNSTVPSNVAEEQVILFPDDWQPPRHPDNSNIMSSENPPTDDDIISSSSCELRPCMDDNSITHVKPFMDDGLPPVHI